MVMDRRGLREMGSACDRGWWWTTVVGVGVELPPDVVDQLVSGHMPAPLIRTDFSDDEAWEELLQRARRPYPPDDFQAMLQPLSDERLDGLEGSDLAGSMPASSPSTWPTRAR